MQTYPCAKINLGLNIVERRADGYHNLETVFLPLPLTDVLEVEEAPTLPDGECRLTVIGADNLCPDQQNLVVKAYRQLAVDRQLPAVTVRLTKNIPSQAGMGGGSSDAAYMLRTLNSMFSLQLSVADLQAYAAQLGADCPLFITADADHPLPIYATGIGDRLQPFPHTLPQLRGKWMLLVKPHVAVSTKEAYAGITPRPSLYNCRETLRLPLEAWRERLTNDFEDSVFAKLPVLRQVKESLYAHGALYAAMTGSGSTLFGIFQDEPLFAKELYKEHYCTTFTIQ